MPASFLINPASFVHTSSGNPDNNIPALSAGSNRKLVVTLVAEDADTWTITTMQVGGQSPDVTHTGINTSDSTAECRIRSFEWHEATIALMTGTSITFADSAFINPMGITYYLLQDVAQASGVQTSSLIHVGNTTQQITTSLASTNGDAVVATVVSGDDTWDIVNASGHWDGLTEYDASTSNTNYFTGIAASTTTSSSEFTFTFTTGENVRAACEILVHAQADTSTVSISDVEPIIPPVIFDNELRVVINGVDFGVSQGGGSVTLNDTDPATTTPSTSVTQTVRTWADTEIVIDVDKGALASDNVWLGVTTNGSDVASTAITVYDDPGQGGVGIRVNPVPNRTIENSTAFSVDMSQYFFASDAQDQVTYSISGQPSGVSINTNTGLISGTIADGQNASSPFTVTVTATDTDSNQVNDQFTWTVSAAGTSDPTVDITDRLTRPGDTDIKAFIVAKGGPWGGSIQDDIRRALIIALAQGDHNDLALDDLWQKYIES